jgi:hypothetical protein
MRLLRRSLVPFLIIGCSLGACGSDDKPTAIGSLSTIATESSDSPSGADATQPPAAGGDVDCEALTTALADLSVSWQVVIGLVNSPSSEWAGIPLGNVKELGNKLAVVTAALGSDADAASALSFMSGANDIVVRGFGGDAAAQADLTAYLGTDVTANVSKQIPIATAYQNVGCK